MYLAIRRYRVQKDNLNEILTKTESGFIPALMNIPGFIDYYYTYSDGNVVTVGVFENREGADQSFKLASEWVQKNISGLYAGPPEVISGEVLFHGREKVGKAA